MHAVRKHEFGQYQKQKNTYDAIIFSLITMQLNIINVSPFSWFFSKANLTKQLLKSE